MKLCETCGGGTGIWRHDGSGVDNLGDLLREDDRDAARSLAVQHRVPVVHSHEPADRLPTAHVP